VVRLRADASLKRKGNECNQEQAEVLAEPNEDYVELSSAGVAA
jgi:hypothetical protein